MTIAIDKSKLRALQWSIMETVSACSILPLMRIGDELGLFAALAEAGPCSCQAFADAAGIDERYAREWLHALCAAGYCSHDDAFETFHLSAEQQLAVVDFVAPPGPPGAGWLTFDLHGGLRTEPLVNELCWSVRLLQYGLSRRL